MDQPTQDGQEPPTFGAAYAALLIEQFPGVRLGQTAPTLASSSPLADLVAFVHKVLDAPPPPLHGTSENPHVVHPRDLAAGRWGMCFCGPVWCGSYDELKRELARRMTQS